MADFLLGLPQSSSIRYGDTDTYFSQNIWTGFVNDDWKIHPRLTLDFGLRYEYFSPFSEKYNHIANLDIAPDYAAVAVVTPGRIGPYSGTFPSGLINPELPQLLAARRARLEDALVQTLHHRSRRIRHLLQHPGLQPVRAAACRTAALRHLLQPSTPAHRRS